MLKCSRRRRVQAVVLANVALALATMNSRSAALSERLKKVAAVLRLHGVPASLQRRVADSIEYYWAQRYGVQDRELLTTLPPRCACTNPKPGCLLCVRVY